MILNQRLPRRAYQYDSLSLSRSLNLNNKHGACIHQYTVTICSCIKCMAILCLLKNNLPRFSHTMVWGKPTRLPREIHHHPPVAVRSSQTRFVLQQMHWGDSPRWLHCAVTLTTWAWRPQSANFSQNYIFFKLCYYY